MPAKLEAGGRLILTSQAHSVPHAEAPTREPASGSRSPLCHPAGWSLLHPRSLLLFPTTVPTTAHTDSAAWRERAAREAVARGSAPAPRRPRRSASCRQSRRGTRSRPCSGSSFSSTVGCASGRQYPTPASRTQSGAEANAPDRERERTRESHSGRKRCAAGRSATRAGARAATAEQARSAHIQLEAIELNRLDVEALRRRDGGDVLLRNVERAQVSTLSTLSRERGPQAPAARRRARSWVVKPGTPLPAFSAPSSCPSCRARA